MVARATSHTQSNRFTSLARRGRHLLLEALESRTLLSSTLFVTPSVPPDATHFPTLQAALLTAATGDTVVLQSGFSPGTFLTTALTQPAAAGAASLHTAAALDVGDVISIGNNVGGDTLERGLVTAVSPTGSGDYLITLASPLQQSHTGSVVDANNGAFGPALGLNAGITLTADAGVVLPFGLEIWHSSASSQTTLSHLNLGAHALFVDGDGSTIADSTLGPVFVQAGSRQNAFLRNTITTGDGLSLERADGTILDSNTINITSTSAFGVLVHNSANVLIINNLIQAGSGASALFVSADGTDSTSIDIRNNTLQTTGGFGLVLSKSDTTAGLDARVQGNNFNHNAIGVYVVGDGTSAGHIDLGGGTSVLGTSAGGNDFSACTTADAGHFAIGLFGTDGNYVLPANANLWGVADPLSVVADATHDPAANGSGIVVAAPIVQQETLTATAHNQSAVETGSSSGVVATFSSNLPHVAGDFAATINWGDGSTSPGTIVANSDGTFSVQGTHTWDAAGTYNFSVTIASNGGATVSATGTAAIASRVLTVDGKDFTSAKGKTFTGTVATFTDNLPGTTAASYTATVTWSDGQTTSATITKNADGSFSLNTSRAFTKAGVIVASVSLATTDGLFSGTASLTATITNPGDHGSHGKCHHILQFIHRWLSHHAPARHYAPPSAHCHR